LSILQSVAREVRFGESAETNSSRRLLPRKLPLRQRPLQQNALAHRLPPASLILVRAEQSVSEIADASVNQVFSRTSEFGYEGESQTRKVIEIEVSYQE